MTHEAVTRVALVLVGDELCEGDRRDGNGVWMARELTAAGAHVTGMRLVRDDEHEVADTLEAMSADADLVIVSGGLGPTEDDRTREGMARALGVSLTVDEDALEAIRRCLVRRGRAATSARGRQARVPEGHGWLENPVGVAPGVRAQVGETIWLAVPGVPGEMRAMFDLHVRPLLRTRTSAECKIGVCGRPEPELARVLDAALASHDVRIGYYPHEGEITVRLVASGPEAAARVADARAEALALLGPDAWRPHVAEGRIEHEVVRLLAASGMTVAAAESITGGLVAHSLTRAPGASAVLTCGWVTYATASKVDRLGLSRALIEEHGVVSEAVARAMAEAARTRAGTTLAVATTGVAGPGPLERPGRPALPAGRVHVACAVDGGATTHEVLDIPMPRPLVQRRAAVRALDLLRRAALLRGNTARP